MDEKGYCVYRHTFPDGRVYIGITSQKPEERWDNGMGYANNKRMFFDIVQYGWRNIAHEIIADGLDREAAMKMERDMILSYGTNGRVKTYNRANAKYEQSAQKDWLDEFVTEQTIKKYHAEFVNLNDFWMETYKARMGAFPFSTELHTTGVELQFYLPKAVSNDGDVKIMYITQFCAYPKDIITFREVHKWLNSGPEFQNVNMEVEWGKRPA